MRIPRWILSSISQGSKPMRRFVSNQDPPSAVDTVIIRNLLIYNSYCTLNRKISWCVFCICMQLVAVELQSVTMPGCVKCSVWVMVIRNSVYYAWFCSANFKAKFKVELCSHNQCHVHNAKCPCGLNQCCQMILSETASHDLDVTVFINY